MSVLDFLLDIIYPSGNRCSYCGDMLLAEEINGLCPTCLSEIEIVRDYCRCCGRKLKEGEVCGDCRGSRPLFDQARGVSIYRGLIKDLLLRFKYYHAVDLVRPLGALLYYYFRKYYLEYSIDYIIPIPLHRERLEMRGYNQAKLLAQYLHDRTGIPLLTGFLLREINTAPLFNLNLKERAVVLSGVFSIEDSENIRGKSVLLVDDILTTGSTVNEVSCLLKEEAKVKRVYVLTVSTARLRS